MFKKILESRKKIREFMLWALWSVFVFLLVFVAVNRDVQFIDFTNRKYLVIGTNYSSPPFGFIDKNGKLVGFDIDIITAMANSIGYEISFEDVKFSEMFEKVVNNKVDLAINRISVTPERAEIINFTSPYFTGRPVLATTDKTIHSLKDLKGKRIGISKNSIYIKTLENLGIKNNIFQYDIKYADSFYLAEVLLEGDVDVIISNDNLIRYFIQNNKNAKNVRIIKEISIGEETDISMIVNRNNEHLLQLLNIALEVIKTDGTYISIVNKWFGGWETK